MRKDLLEKFDELKKKEDANLKYKLGLITVLEHVILSAECRTLVDEKWFHFVEDLEHFNSYPWGNLSYGYTVKLFKPNSFGKTKNPKSITYSLHGFPLAMMVWAFEALPELGRQFVEQCSTGGLPRIMCWKMDKHVRSEQLITFFNTSEVQVRRTLQPSSDEVETSYLKDFGITSEDQESVPEDEEEEEGEKNDAEDEDGGLFHMLGLPDVHILGPFISVIYEFFTAKTSMFTINGHVMGITLEDVLYLLRLPINGELVLVGENSHLSYKKFFGEDSKKVKISHLNRIVYNSTENKEKRMRALLLIIIWHFVMPTKNGDGIYPSLASLLENPYNTSSIHAWGAAVLAFLHGRKKKNKEGGNLWLVLAFFLVRIPKLWTILGVEITREELEELARVDYPLKWIMTCSEKVSKNTRVNYKGALRNALESLEDEDIHWRPYMTWELPGDLQSNIDWVRRVSPIFANNYVVHHAPHLLAKQFGLANNVKYTLYHIRMKDNQGSKSHNWTKKYEVHNAKWMNPFFLVDPPAVHRGKKHDYSL
ncbi:Unknown protein [Striga hermonthica]|uniref:Aminotransferase-like plant mobile domain-containing protein n=1 Tax=Striga hermonthica TaxID=68872 RepID=A0A9N7MQC2_STRHE|nr:Unknown protein [Striga hermonthica]